MDIGELFKQSSSLPNIGIDLLCCQSITHVASYRHSDQASETGLIARHLNMTCSCFAADRLDRPQQGAPTQENRILRGQAIFTGTGIWTLNSGSFVIGEGDDEEVVLFALVRKNGISVLVFNLRLAADSEAQEFQLLELFQHSLLKEIYGAVVLCTDREAVLPMKKWHSITNGSPYSAPQHLASANDGLLGLLTARNQPDFTLIEKTVQNHRDQEQPPRLLPGLSLTVDIKRIVNSKRSRPSFPLSFREQWLGYRDNRVFA
jgi:hypothetical protein